MDIIDAIVSRASTRAYLDKPVRREVLEGILDLARWTPSGGNIQPWELAVVTGETKERITGKILEARAEGHQPNPDYIYYPQKWFEPYKTRRIACGAALYESLGIERADRKRRKEVWEDNFRFFGAPVGLLFFMDRRLGQGFLIDMGMFMQNVMLAARAHELATCPQASFVDYGDIIRKILGISCTYMLVCGMSLGYPDKDAPVNQCRTKRAAVEEFTRWYG